MGYYWWYICHLSKNDSTLNLYSTFTCVPNIDVTTYSDQAGHEIIKNIWFFTCPTKIANVLLIMWTILLAKFSETHGSTLNLYSTFTCVLNFDVTTYSDQPGYEIIKDIWFFTCPTKIANVPLIMWSIILEKKILWLMAQHWTFIAPSPVSQTLMLQLILINQDMKLLKIFDFSLALLK